jgi:hypothetical protein
MGGVGRWHNLERAWRYAFLLPPRAVGGFVFERVWKFPSMGDHEKFFEKAGALHRGPEESRTSRAL